MTGTADSALRDGAGSALGKEPRASAPERPACPSAQRLTARLVALIERDGLSVAAAARRVGVDVHAAGMLVRLHAIELECAEAELAERLEEIQEMCPGEDWWSYTDRQLNSIFSGEAIPNRIVRELVLAWRRRTGKPTARLAEELRISPEALRRSVGLAAVSGRRTGGRPRFQRTITVQAAGRIVQAIGIPACEVPGL
jgi:transposase